MLIFSVGFILLAVESNNRRTWPLYVFPFVSLGASIQEITSFEYYDRYHYGDRSIYWKYNLSLFIQGVVFIILLIVIDYIRTIMYKGLDGNQNKIIERT